MYFLLSTGTGRIERHERQQKVLAKGKFLRNTYSTTSNAIENARELVTVVFLLTHNHEAPCNSRYS